MAKSDPDSIIAELRGQSIVLPDLNALFENWPKQVNADLERLRHDVDEWLDRYSALFPHPRKDICRAILISVSVSTMSHNSKLEALKAADFAYFGATWYPQARYDRLRVVTLLAAWASQPVFAPPSCKPTKSNGFFSCSLGTMVRTNSIQMASSHDLVAY